MLALLQMLVLVLQMLVIVLQILVIVLQILVLLSIPSSHASACMHTVAYMHTYTRKHDGVALLPLLSAYVHTHTTHVMRLHLKINLHI